MSDNSSNVLLYHCSNYTLVRDIDSAITVLRIVLLLPLCTLVLYFGQQRWRQQRSFTTSHSDIFTYHMAAMQMIWILGCFCYFYGGYADIVDITMVGICTTSFVFYGETFLQTLTCVERYMAVVHPIIYLRLRNTHGVWIRHISIGCVWLLSLAMTGLATLYIPFFPTVPFFCTLVFSLIVVSFCSLSTLCALIRPGPGEGSGEKERVDQTKQRAFQTITAITGVLWLWLVGYVVCIAMDNSSLLSDRDGCLVMTCAGFLNLPCSLVLFVLYLHRANLN